MKVNCHGEEAVARSEPVSTKPRWPPLPLLSFPAGLISVLPDHLARWHRKEIIGCFSTTKCRLHKGKSAG
jgi:hypothetical protein